MNEKSLEDFFNETDEEIKPSKPKENKKEEKVKFKSIKEFLKAKFSFDAQVDLTNETSVLYRKNEVIRNIITVSNWLFIIFSFVGMSLTTSNLIVTAVFFLLVTGLSDAIKIMLQKKKDDYNHQVLIMYLQSIFIFVKAIVLYIKTYLGYADLSGSGTLSIGEYSVTQAAYFLIFYSILIESLYQDINLIKHSFSWVFLVMTVINITLLHPELYNYASSISDLFNYVVGNGTIIGIDILLRTFVLLIFFAALYISTSIVKQTNIKRSQEYSKRVDVEKNFKDVVLSVFTAVKAYNLDLDVIETEIKSRKCVSVSLELAKAFNLDSVSLTEVKEKAKIHSEYFKELNLNNIDEINESNFNEVLTKTELAKDLMVRLELSKRAEDIVYRVFEANVTDKFIENVKPERLDLISNIILLCEIYIILRSDRAYKKALNHQRSLDIIIDNMAPFFMSDVIIRFKKFNSEINKAYEFS